MLLTKATIAILRLSSALLWALGFKLISAHSSAAIAGEVLFVYSLSNITSVFGRAGQNIIAVKQISISPSSHPDLAGQEIFVFLNSIFISLLIYFFTALLGRPIPSLFPLSVLLFSLQIFYADILRAKRDILGSLIFGSTISSLLFAIVVFLSHSKSTTFYVSCYTISYLISIFFLRLKIKSRAIGKFRLSNLFFHSFSLRAISVYVRDSYLLAVNRSLNLFSNDLVLLILGMAGFYDLVYIVGMSARITLIIGFALIAAQTYSDPILASKASFAEGLQYVRRLSKLLFIYSTLTATAMVVSAPLWLNSFFPGYENTEYYIIFIACILGQLVNTSMGPYNSLYEYNSMFRPVLVSNSISILTSGLILAIGLHANPYYACALAAASAYIFKNLLYFIYSAKSSYSHV